MDSLQTDPRILSLLPPKSRIYMRKMLCTFQRYATTVKESKTIVIEKPCSDGCHGRVEMYRTELLRISIFSKNLSRLAPFPECPV